MEAIREGDAGKAPGLVNPSLSDGELIDRICDGCQKATEEFFVNRYGWLLRYLSVRHGDEDLTSEIFLHLCSSGTWARLRKWDGRSKFSTWLAVVAHHLHAEKTKSRGRQRENLHKYAALDRRLDEDERAKRDQPVVAITGREDALLRRSAILRALNTLPARDQLLLSLLDLRDPPEKIEKVADLLNQSVPVVRVAHTRAKGRLRKALERNGGVDHE